MLVRSKNVPQTPINLMFNPLAVPAPHLLSPFLAHQPSPQSSLKITDRSFRYASPRLWNQLPDSFRQPHQSCLDSPLHSLVSSSLLSSLLSSSITPSLFHSRLKTYLFNKIILSILDFFYLPDCLHDNGTGPDLSCSWCSDRVAP